MLTPAISGCQPVRTLLVDVVSEAVTAGFIKDKARLMPVELVVVPEFRNYDTPINEWPAVVAEK